MLKYIFILIFSSSLLFADDGFIGAWSASISPMKKQSSDIEMSKEVVYIKMGKDTSEVWCKFWMYNHGKTQKILVGFPDYHVDQFSFFCPLMDFRSKVNGLDVKLEKYSYIEQIDTSNYDNKLEYDTVTTHWYTKEIEFKAGDTVMIEDYYKALNGSQIGYSSAYLAKSFHYFIGSGKTWKGPIGNGLIIFDHSNVVSNYFMEQQEEYNKKSSKNKIKRELLDDFTIYQFKKYKPSEFETVNVQLIDLNYPIYTGDSINSEQDGNIIDLDSYILANKSLTACDLKIMANEILARLNYKFEDKFLSNYFKTQSWYHTYLPEKPIALQPHYIRTLFSKLEEFYNIKSGGIKEDCSKNLRFQNKNQEKLMEQIHLIKQDFGIR